MDKEVFLVDSNIFLEMLLGQARAAECAAFLRMVEQKSRHIVVLAFSLYGMEVILESKGSRDAIGELLDRCEKSPAVEVLHTNLQDEREIYQLGGTKNLDIDDAHQYWAVKKLNARLVSFDTDFDKTDLRRFEPAEILKEFA